MTNTNEIFVTAIRELATTGRLSDETQVSLDEVVKKDESKSAKPASDKK